MSRPCDLLPLPVVDEARSEDAVNFRSYHRRAGLSDHINEVCAAINSMDSSTAGMPLPASNLPHSFGNRATAPAAAQKAVRARLGQAIRRLGKPPAPADRHGALQELLRSPDVYDLDRQESRRPYQYELVNV